VKALVPARRSRQAVLRLKIGIGALVLLSLALLLWPADARAETKDHQFALEESGRATCAMYTHAREGSPQATARYIGFIEGYLTAANRYEPNTFDLTPWHTPEAFALILDEHCAKNPTEALAMVAQQIVVAMMPLRLADKSDLVAIGEGSQQTIVYQRIIWRAQDELTRRGLYRGKRDGADSPEFRTALTHFQQLARLDPSGLPDTATLWVLLNP
jgi:hypothetical protein